MTDVLLHAATEVSQMDGEAGEWEHCSCATTASVAIDAGKVETVAQVVAIMRADGTNPDQGELEEEIVRALGHLGIPAHVISGDASIDAALSRRHNLIWRSWSDGQGNINGSRHATHYTRLFGHDAAGVHGMNPLGSPVFGKNYVLADATFFANSYGRGVEIDIVLPADAQEEPMNLSTKRAHVRSIYLAALGREPESLAILDGWANSIKDDGSNTDVIAAAIADSSEGQAYRTKLQALLAGKPVPAEAATVAKIVEADIAGLLAAAAAKAA